MKKSELKNQIDRLKNSLTKQRIQRLGYQETIDRQADKLEKLDSALIKYKAESRRRDQTLRGLLKEFLRLERELMKERGFKTYFIESPFDISSGVSVNIEYVDNDIAKGVEYLEIFEILVRDDNQERGVKFAEIRFCPAKQKEYEGGAKAYIASVAEGVPHDATRLMTPAGLAREFNKANPRK